LVVASSTSRRTRAVPIANASRGHAPAPSQLQLPPRGGRVGPSTPAGRDSRSGSPVRPAAGHDGPTRTGPAGGRARRMPTAARRPQPGGLAPWWPELAGRWSSGTVRGGPGGGVLGGEVLGGQVNVPAGRFRAGVSHSLLAPLQEASLTGATNTSAPIRQRLPDFFREPPLVRRL
jgi:hypothetical protein